MASFTLGKKWTLVLITYVAQALHGAWFSHLILVFLSTFSKPVWSRLPQLPLNTSSLEHATQCPSSILAYLRPLRKEPRSRYWYWRLECGELARIVIGSQVSRCFCSLDYRSHWSTRSRPITLWRSALESHSPQPQWTGGVVAPLCILSLHMSCCHHIPADSQCSGLNVLNIWDPILWILAFFLTVSLLMDPYWQHFLSFPLTVKNHR